MIRLAQKYLTVDSIVDGEGIRAVLWTQGCPHNCEGCHNPETHSMNAGHEVTIDSVKSQIDNAVHIGQDGLTLSGGDPFMQPKACSEIAEYAISKGLNIWCYTGYTFEQLLKMSPEHLRLLNSIDVLIDGKFRISQKSLNTKFRGSSNQRIIDVQASLAQGKTVLCDEWDRIITFIPIYQKAEGIFC